jgi:hypothetical protein
LPKPNAIDSTLARYRWLQEVNRGLKMSESDEGSCGRSDAFGRAARPGGGGSPARHVAPP